MLPGMHVFSLDEASWTGPRLTKSCTCFMDSDELPLPPTSVSWILTTALNVRNWNLNTHLLPFG